MAHKYDVEYTDTFAGEANYSWVKRATITMPELTHYGYDGGTNYAKANRVFERELMKRAKAEMGLTGVRGTVERYGDSMTFRPYRSATVLFVTYLDEALAGASTLKGDALVEAARNAIELNDE